MYTQDEKIIARDIEEEVKDSYLNYAMSVIVGRALPDVKDGLKPVHRRILYAMYEDGLLHNRPFRKSATVVGNVIGRYHPHGDLAVYDALVRLAQDWNMRYLLIDSQGNFGSIDGDPAAAYRYTEARLNTIAEEMLSDIEKETVRFVPNFDNSRSEPWILPGKLPNLLVNGSSGIAVGMATNMPPHNLGEVLAATIHLIDNPTTEIKELMRYIRGPDFPTGGLICGRKGIKEAYENGKGKLTMRAVASIEHQKQGRDSIVITEIPYQVNKANLIESIASLVEDKRVEGITDIRDESDKEGIRVIVELKRDVEPQIILNQLFKHTHLELTFGVINLALVDGRPRILNLKQLLSLFISHRKEIIRRRTQFDLAKAEKRAHILEGLKIALKHIDRIIKTIKTSKNTEEARNRLIKEFGLTVIQAQAILEMQLQRLTALERSKIEAEYLDLIKKIQVYKSILASEKKIEEIIKEECHQLQKKYADERRTKIVAEVEEIEIEDLIVEEDMVITISHLGYIKRLSVSSYRKQRRGGRGVTAMETREEDFVKHLFIASSKDCLLIFTNKGKAYWLKVYEIPEASRTAKGKAVVNLLALSAGERISSVVAVKEFSEDRYLLMCTKQGLVKKIKLSCFSNPRRGGIVAIKLAKDDHLVETGLTDGKQRILLATRKGKSVLFKEQQIRDMGRAARGVRGIRLEKKGEIVGMVVLPSEAEKMKLTLLTVTTGGFAKRTAFSETQKGMMVRCPVKDIRHTGRNTQGVRLISLDKDDTVASIAKIVAKEE
ncbi:MAG: DNA gyrase subunit A [Omnitrophica WOR_2 bacterium SM23_29]|nr:MAG: DNA gyrase subunit A [Omnitrophica WOR_2 bacterium SM23_29]